MLSVLSSGTLNLSEELAQARAEAQRLCSENSQLHDLLTARRRRFYSHVDTVARVCYDQEDTILKQVAFLSLQGWRNHKQVWKRRFGSEAKRSSAWLWLWKKKVISLWRRASDKGRREALVQLHRDDVTKYVHDNEEVMQLLVDARSKNQNLTTLLEAERHRVAELSKDLAEARAQVSELQATLKDSYMQQFEEVSQRQSLEQHFSSLVSDMSQLRSQHETLTSEIAQKRDELARYEALQTERELRLHEASGELSLAEEVIDDITSSKVIGMQRFFEKYNLPGVLVALFRKLLELQGKTRSRGCMTTFTQSQSSIGSVASSLTASPLHSSSSQLSPLHSEVRDYLSVHRDGTVSRHGFQAYIEGLHLQLVSAPMVTQVVLALLDLDLGEGPCEVHRFVTSLTSPPPWEQLEFATALWGSVGEPAAAVVQQHRRNAARTSSGTIANARKVSVTSPRGQSKMTVAVR